MKEFIKWLKVIIVVFSTHLLFISCNSQYKASKAESVKKTAEAADELLLVTKGLREEINKKVETNPNSAAADFVPLVDKKTREIERTQTALRGMDDNKTIDINQKRTFSKIRSYQQKIGNLGREIRAINKSFEKELDKKLKSDVYFDTGSADIQNEGDAELRKIILTDISDMINEWRKEEVYKNKTLRVKIKVVGYADLQGPANIELRRNSNLALSEKRAESVKNSVMKYLEELNKSNDLDIQVESEGKGEVAPPGLTDEALINNPERRVCFISGYIIPVF